MKKKKNTDVQPHKPHKQLVNCTIGSLEPVFLDAGLIFLFYILLIWGCVRTQPTPLPTGLVTPARQYRTVVSV